MSTRQLISLRARQIEAQFESTKHNLLLDFAQRELQTAVEARGYTPSDYQLYAVRRNERAGQEVFGPKTLTVGMYSEAELYGASNSLLPQFWSALRALATRANHIKELDQYNVEFSYQVTLFWAEVTRLKDFIGLSAHVSEIVSEFLTARYHFLGKDTSIAIINAIAEVLSFLFEMKRLDVAIVERVVDILEEGAGIDSLVLDALRQHD